MSILNSHQAPVSPLWIPGLLLTGFCFSACTVDDDDLANFVTRTLSQSVAATSPIAVNDQYAAFPASELGTGAAGTDFNSDGDFNDDVIVTLNLGNDVVVQTGAALDPGVGSEGMAWVNNVLFFVVDEGADSTDWNTDLDSTDKVLVYWHAGMTAPMYYDTLDETAIYASNDELLYVSDTAPVALRDSNLYAIPVPTSASAPSPRRMIQTSLVDPVGNGISVDLRGESNGVVWMTVSESDEGGDLNGDLDATDSAILAVMGTGSGGEIQVVPLAMRNGSTTVEVLEDGADRIVAFFVDEATQGANLNDPSLFAGLWQAAQCAAVDDADTLDEVLHWFSVIDFTANAIANPPINTGLVGSDQIYSLGSQWLGVISDEADEGDAGGCDLNADGDKNDQILRWVETTLAPAPVNDATKLIALDTGVSGGSGGVIALNGDLFVALVDEGADGRDHDGNAGSDDEFLGVLDPNLPGTGWNFDQGAATFIRVSWMAPDPAVQSRFLAAIKESSTGVDANNDGDLLDSIPTFPIEAGAPRELDFPGVSVGVERNNAGITTRGNYGYYRLSEADQRFDYNLDGDQTDTILQRVDLTGGSQAISMGVLQNLAMDSIMVGRGPNPKAILWMAPEGLEGPAGTDLNGDGDANDIALRYARIP